MSENVKKYGLLAIKAVLTLAFVAAGFAKLSGQEMMVQTFEAVGVGQWFRYVTGIIEVGAAVLLWVKGMQFHRGWFVGLHDDRRCSGASVHHWPVGRSRCGARDLVGDCCLQLPWAVANCLPVVLMRPNKGKPRR